MRDDMRLGGWLHGIAASKARLQTVRFALGHVYSNALNASHCAGAQPKRTK